MAWPKIKILGAGRDKGHGGRTVFRGNEVDELRRKVVAKLAQRAGKFRAFDGARVVCVKMAEDTMTHERKRGRWRRVKKRAYFCQSAMYFHNPANSLKLIEPL